MNKKNTFGLFFTYLALILFAFNNCSKVGDNIPMYDPMTDPTYNPQYGKFMADSNNQLRVAMLEDFTGVRCQYCPAGHDTAKQLLAENPGKFIIIAVHGGSFGSALAGWPNFCSEYAPAILSRAQVKQYPGGTMSRILASSMPVTPQPLSKYALDREEWRAAAAFVMKQKAPVNIGAKAWYNEKAGTKYLSIKVDLYYTMNQPGDYINSHNIQIALLQDKLHGKQYVFPLTEAVADYEQNNVLRTLITGEFGSDVSDSGVIKGTKIRRVYNYPLPTDFNGTSSDGGGAVVLSNLKIVVFVTIGDFNVLNAKSVVISNQY